MIRVTKAGQPQGPIYITLTPPMALTRFATPVMAKPKWSRVLWATADAAAKGVRRHRTVQPPGNGNRAFGTVLHEVDLSQAQERRRSEVIRGRVPD